MGKRRIDAREALEAIQSGMADHELMVKFRLSAKGLQSLFSKLAGAGAVERRDIDDRVPGFQAEVFLFEDLTRKGGSPVPAQEQNRAARKKDHVDAKEFLVDVRSGMSDAALMHKYRISSKGLQHVLDQVADAGLMSAPELEQRSMAFDATVDVMEMIRQIGEPIPSLDPENKVLQTCPACGEPQTILFAECPACGVNIEQYRRRQERCRRESEAQWKCPACGRPWTQEFDECPVCGVIVSKLKDQG
jgi:hypothetical protein